MYSEKETNINTINEINVYLSPVFVCVCVCLNTYTLRAPHLTLFFSPDLI